MVLMLRLAWRGGCRWAIRRLLLLSQEESAVASQRSWGGGDGKKWMDSMYRLQFPRSVVEWIGGTVTKPSAFGTSRMAIALAKLRALEEVQGGRLWDSLGLRVLVMTETAKKAGIHADVWPSGLHFFHTRQYPSTGEERRTSL